MIEVRGDRIIVKGFDDPDKVGHIFIPETAKNRADQGIILFAGPRVRWVGVGDVVMFSPYSGTNITLDGEGTYTVLREAACICKLHAANIPVNGLYHRTKDGEYFPASVESSISSIKFALEHSEWRKKAKILGEVYTKTKRDTTIEEEYELGSEDEEQREYDKKYRPAIIKDRRPESSPKRSGSKKRVE